MTLAAMPNPMAPTTTHESRDHRRGFKTRLATIETYDVMSPDFPDDPELAVDIDPDLAYVERAKPKKTVSSPRSRRWQDDSQRDD